MEQITNQTVAVFVLAMIMTGIGWIARQLFALLPNLLERYEAMEQRRSDKLSEDLRNMADKIEISVGKMEASNQQIIKKVNDLMVEQNEKHKQHTDIILSNFSSCFKDLGVKLHNMNQAIDKLCECVECERTGNKRVKS